MLLLEALPGIDLRAFADDLAMGFINWNCVMHIFPVIDSFSIGSRVYANIKKTKFITSSISTPDLTKVLSPIMDED